MIAMLVADCPEIERKKLLQESKWQAARLTDESWVWIECDSAKSLLQAAEGGRRLDIMCLDLTMQKTEQMLSAAEKLRHEYPIAYMILIANTQISPVRYMKPTINAQSLLLKPLDGSSVREVLSESIESYLARLRIKDDNQYFVLETRGEKELIPNDRIMYFEAREKKVFLNTGDMEYPFYDTLDQLEERFSGTFLRCHRSFLVNKKKISRVYFSQNALALSGGEEIPLSRSYKPVVKEFLSNKQRKDQLD